MDAQGNALCETPSAVFDKVQFIPKEDELHTPVAFNSLSKNYFAASSSMVA